MAVFIEQLAAANGAYFIHTVGKLIAAILDQNARHIQRLINPVNISNAAHDTSNSIQRI